jgi:hypothetical protein
MDRRSSQCDRAGQWDGDGIGANNDIAIVWPPDRKPLLVTAYYLTRTTDVTLARPCWRKWGGLSARCNLCAALTGATHVEN